MNISSQRLFRTLVAAAAVLHVLLWSAPLAGPGRLKTFDVWLLDFDGYGAFIDYSPVLYWCLFASWLLVFAGLFFYVAAARTGLVILIGISIGLSLAWGIRVLTPYEAAAGPLLAVIDGAVIAMAYLAPIRMEFERHR